MELLKDISKKYIFITRNMSTTTKLSPFSCPTYHADLHEKKSFRIWKEGKCFLINTAHYSYSQFVFITTRHNICLLCIFLTRKSQAKKLHKHLQENRKTISLSICLFPFDCFIRFFSYSLMFLSICGFVYYTYNITVKRRWVWKYFIYRKIFAENRKIVQNLINFILV